LLTLKARGFGQFKKVKPIEKFKKDFHKLYSFIVAMREILASINPQWLRAWMCNANTDFSRQSLRQQHRDLARFRLFYGLGTPDSRNFCHGTRMSAQQRTSPMRADASWKRDRRSSWSPMRPLSCGIRRSQK
jgi:hypothetical protein